MPRITGPQLRQAQRLAANPAETLPAWWNITTTRGRYTIQAADETAAETETLAHTEPGEIILDGMNTGPYATQQEAETA